MHGRGRLGHHHHLAVLPGGGGGGAQLGWRGVGPRGHRDWPDGVRLGGGDGGGGSRLGGGSGGGGSRLGVSCGFGGGGWVGRVDLVEGSLCEGPFVHAGGPAGWRVTGRPLKRAACRDHGHLQAVAGDV